MAVNTETKTAKPQEAKPLVGKERAEFLRLSKACSNPDQVKRITARLSLTNFIALHGELVCQRTYDAILKADRATKKKKK